MPRIVVDKRLSQSRDLNRAESAPDFPGLPSTLCKVGSG